MWYARTSIIPAIWDRGKTRGKGEKECNCLVIPSILERWTKKIFLFHQIARFNMTMLRAAFFHSKRVILKGTFLQAITLSLLCGAVPSSHLKATWTKKKVLRYLTPAFLLCLWSCTEPSHSCKVLCLIVVPPLYIWLWGYQTITKFPGCWALHFAELSREGKDHSTLTWMFSSEYF